MINLLTYGGIGVLVGLFCYFDGYLIVKDSVGVKWKKFRKINKLVATNYKGIFTIIWISLYMVLQALWINIIQYLNNSIIPMKNGKYKVTYVIKGKTYRMIVKPKKGPRKVLIVYNENQEDVSYLVFPYLGPDENFHGDMYTPNFFDCDELVFELSNGSDKIFKRNDKIIFE